MENAISIVRGEAEKHFSDGINCRLLCARLYHTSQQDLLCCALEEAAFKPPLAAAREGGTPRSPDRRRNLETLLFKLTETLSG